MSISHIDIYISISFNVSHVVVSHNNRGSQVVECLLVCGLCEINSLVPQPSPIVKRYAICYIMQSRIA